MQSEEKVRAFFIHTTFRNLVIIGYLVRKLYKSQKRRYAREKQKESITCIMKRCMVITKKTSLIRGTKS